MFPPGFPNVPTWFFYDHQPLVFYGKSEQNQHLHLASALFQQISALHHHIFHRLPREGLDLRDTWQRGCSSTNKMFQLGFSLVPYSE